METSWFFNNQSMLQPVTIPYHPSSVLPLGVIRTLVHYKHRPLFFLNPEKPGASSGP